MKLSTAHRKVKREKTYAGSKPPRELGPADATVYTREDGPTVQLCGDSEVVGKWMNGKNSLGRKYQENEMIQKTLHQWWKKIANPVSSIDDYVKHIFREHNLEADHWANVGAEGQKKVVIDKKSNADTRKAVKGFLGWQLQEQWKKWVRCGDQRSRQSKMGHDQQNCSCSESWYSHSGRNGGCACSRES